MLDKITPVLLTLNEAPNISRVLEKLAWAGDIVVVDSGSTDETLAIIKQYPQVRCYHRTFDNHAAQWNYAVHETAIKTEWVLALDADYILSDEFVQELKQLQPDTATQGYRTRFKYCIDGRPLHGSLYPPVTVLYRKNNAYYEQDGHTQRLKLAEPVKWLQGFIFHDDRKPLWHWFMAQQRYMILESRKLATTPWRDLTWGDRVRKCRIIAPVVVFFYCLLVRGVILDGWPGLYYALQRMVAELILSVYLIRRDIGLTPGQSDVST